MSQRQVLEVFQQYEDSRIRFVQKVSELAINPNNIEALESSGVMQLLRPLLFDIVPTVQQTAALALGRLADFNDDLAEAVIQGDILSQLIQYLAEQNPFYKKAAASVLRSVAKHSPELAQAIVDCGYLSALVVCLGDSDPVVKEDAAWALGYISSHSKQLAQSVVDSGAVPLLILSIQEPELSLKRISVSALSDICKHSPDLAKIVVDAGAIAYLAQMIHNPDTQLQRRILDTLSRISKHSIELAQLIIEAEIFPSILTCLKSEDYNVVENTSTLMRNIVKHTPELAQIVVNAGGISAIVDMLSSNLHRESNVRLSGILMLGYFAAHTENLAMAVIVSKAVDQLAIALAEDKEDQVKAAAVWSLGQVGKHSPKHSKAVAIANVLPRLLHFYLNENSSDDIQLKSKEALDNILKKSTYLPALEPLLHSGPPDILKHVIAQYSKILPHDAKARRVFITLGGLKKVQELSAEEGSELSQHIAAVRRCFPDDILKYYSPNYNNWETEENSDPNCQSNVKKTGPSNTQYSEFKT